MQLDGRKGLDLSWNIINLPNSAVMYGGSLTYCWLSDGTKVSVKTDDGAGDGVQKRYFGSFTCTSPDGSSSSAADKVESVGWDEGRVLLSVSIQPEPLDFPGTGFDPVLEPIDTLVTSHGHHLPTGSSYRDCWFVKDHLGDVRAAVDIAPGLTTPEVLEQSDYLPFGTRFQGLGMASEVDNRWRYAGKEEQRFGNAGLTPLPSTPPFTMDLSLLDFGARLYVPFTARWTAVDPLANKYPGHSPYNYCVNNPINRFDPDGSVSHVAAGMIVGAVVGAAIEGGIAVYHGKSNDEIAGAMVRGAIEGATIVGAAAVAASVGAAVTASAAASALAEGATNAAISAASGAVGSVVDQAISNKSVDSERVIEETQTGFLTGLGGAVAGRVTKAAASMIKKTIGTMYTSSSAAVDKIRNEVKRQYRNAGRKVSGATINRAQAARVDTIVNSEQEFVDFTKGIVDFSVQKNTNSIVEEYKER